MVRLDGGRIQKDVIEFFKLIKSKSDIKTIYVGSGGLWAGKSYPFTEELELIISDMADEYVESASAIDVAEIMGSTTFFLVISHIMTRILNHRLKQDYARM